MFYFYNFMFKKSKKVKKMQKKSKKVQKNLHISKKSCNFAPSFKNEGHETKFRNPKTKPK